MPHCTDKDNHLLEGRTMGLSTHVLDTANGRPAVGMAVELYRVDGDAARLLSRHALNREGRTDAPLLEDGQLQAGGYRLVFAVADYFRAQGALRDEPPFLDRVPLDFGIAHPGQHYHVPLLVSPWAYSTYRGS